MDRYRKPVFEKDPDRIMELLGFAKTAYPTVNARRVMRKARIRPYPMFVDRKAPEPVFYVKPTATKVYVVSKFFQCFSGGKYTHMEFEIAEPAPR